MGAWGKGPLQNDAACSVLDEFFGDLFGEEKVKVLRAAFRYIDDDDSVRAACYILQLLAILAPGRRHGRTNSASCWTRVSSG